MKSDKFYRNNPDDQVLWAEPDKVGEFLFTFDRETVFNLFRDYPEKLTQEQREIFDGENPEWAEYFSDRR